ncbi:anthranilate synthase component I family protein [Daejeonella lutea]|uniref:Para-aminobenzoate synthetase component 1 n=1 Tax=Daejeonella lutea TaxID=572036 RepID=A0A1T5A1Y9_9SPHI|nr:anthranilate synthase component I family protein [Daejeonella lutea]SKB29012.1 para-aminobenzoate synthetase component 1 [Daejeonella lutea]
MPVPKVFASSDPDTFKLKALHWANSFDDVCYFDSNHYSDPYTAFDTLVAAGAKRKISTSSGNSFQELENFLAHNAGFIPGYFSYDLKNELEDLHSSNPDNLDFPELYFFIPEYTILVKGSEVSITGTDCEVIWTNINNMIIDSTQTVSPISIQSRFSKDEYESTVEKLKEHIRRGDIYEINFCQEFFAENAEINPLSIFIRLNTISPTPFSCYMKVGERYIMSATPERFLSRRGDKLISQPIKGTSARNSNKILDDDMKKHLQSDEKELAENVMIVDLVRNDLTKSARPGTVKVEELFGIYSFKQVHQLISTVVCEKAEDLTNSRVIANTFPMGSMTGAPKIRAMALAEKYERSKRGVYSGAVGYFAPNGDFDFNVVIRTLLYNKENKYLSFHTGGAITIDSNPEKEHEECILKAQAIMEVLTQ